MTTNGREYTYKTKTRIYTAVWSYRSGVTKKWRKI